VQIERGAAGVLAQVMVAPVKSPNSRSNERKTAPRMVCKTSRIESYSTPNGGRRKYSVGRKVATIHRGSLAGIGGGGFREESAHLKVSQRNDKQQKIRTRLT